MGNMVQPDVTGAIAVQDVVREEEHTGTWRFRLGQCVSHQSQSMPSLVIGRIRTTKGQEVYGVRSFMNVDPCRDRMILADRLVDVVPGSKPCQDCLLWTTGLCPGDKR